jgi:sulfate adenylyltransferase
MTDLVPAHGGHAEPISCTVAESDRAAFLAEAGKLVRVPVSDADLSTVYRFGDGALTPLTGPMDSATYNRVLDEMVIEHGGKKYAWSIPLSLPVTKDLAAQLKSGQTVALVNSANDIVATLAISDVFEWDKPRYISKVYLTDRTDHPGADMVLRATPTKPISSAERSRSCRSRRIRSSASTC